MKPISRKNFLSIHLGGEFRENDFKFGEITPLAPKRSNMIIHVNCTNPSLNFILCESEERTNAWKFSVTYRFSTVRMYLDPIIYFFKVCYPRSKGFGPKDSTLHSNFSL